MTSGKKLRVFVLTSMWPTSQHPAYGVWVQSQMRSVAERGVSLTVHFVNGRATRWAYARSALRMLRLNWGAREYDVVHAHSGYAGVLALLQRRVPVLTSYIGYDLLGEPEGDWEMSRKSRIESAAFRRLAPFNDRTITKSAEMELALPARARPRNRVLPNGVDQARFRPISRPAARAELGWPEDEPVVLFVGDPAWGRKRFDLASESVEIARAQFPGVRLRVCSYIPQDEVVWWMNASDALILTSNCEGSPNAVKEAMACNLPVVSVAVGDVREVVAGARHCHVTTHDPGALADALCEVLRAAPERSDGRERTRHLELEVIAERLIDLYHETSASRRSSRSPAGGRHGRPVQPPTSNGAVRAALDPAGADEPHNRGNGAHATASPTEVLDR